MSADPGSGALCFVEVHPGKDPTGALARVHGEIDLATADVLERRLDILIRQGTRTLVLDLSGVPFCDVAGLHVLLRVQSELCARRGRLTLLGPCPSLAMMLMALGLSSRLRLQPLAGC